MSDPVLSQLMTSLSSAVNAVSSFENAPASVISSVLAPLTAVRARIDVLLAPLEVTLSNAAGFAGIVAGGSPVDSVSALNAQIAAHQEYTNLLQLMALCGRMANNVRAINASEVTLATAGGNLFQIATQEYGDPMAWTGIAKANGLIDPFIQGNVTLTIPNAADALDGVLES